MRPIRSIYLIFCFCLVISTQTITNGYGYIKDEDPLIKACKAIILYGRQDNWPKVTAEVTSINDRFTDIYKIFKIDFKSQIDHAIQMKDFQTLANKMANVVFLAIREKFFYNHQEKLEIFVRAKVRLRLAEEYYVTVLAGNVRDYDVRHKTSLHESIYSKFVRARDTLGSMGFLGAGALKPDVKEFETLTNEIASLLLTAFPYFEAGEKDPT